MERLIRKLLQMPSRPAVVLLNGYAWFNTEPYEARGALRGRGEGACGALGGVRPGQP